VGPSLSLCRNKTRRDSEVYRAVTTIAKEYGLETAVGQATSDTGNTLKVVEGRGHGLKLWVQSALLSGREDPTLCGIHPEPYPDPAQFIVFTEPRLFGSKVAATELGARCVPSSKNTVLTSVGNRLSVAPQLSMMVRDL